MAPQPEDGGVSTDTFDAEGVCQPGNENTGRWTSDEHRLFLKGLELHGKGWKQIATLIQTRTVVQIRTHAQKYFQKLSKAQASGTSHLDPATLMSTMDAGKPRPASVARSLRSSTIVNTTTESEGRVMSLRNRRNRGRHSRHNDGEDYIDDEASFDDHGDSGRTRRHRSNSSSSSDRGSGRRSCDSDGCSEEEDEERGNEVQSGRPGMMMMMVRQAPKFTIGGGASDVRRPGKNEAGDCMGTGVASLSPPQQGAGAGVGWSKRRLMSSTKSDRSSSSKAIKAIAAAAGGGAADARALAWEAASFKSCAVGADPTAEVAMAAADAVAAAAVVAAGNAAGTKRSRSESTSSTSTLGDTIKNLKRTGGSHGTRISPTSVSDINFMSFPVPHTERSDVTINHLPQQLAPSWCTKPQDTWMAGAGFDIGTDSDDAGPFRWFIDERSLSAPGAFFQPPAETWSGSDTTDASASAGATSGGEGSAVDSDQQTGMTGTIVPELSVCTNKVDMSPVSGAACDDTLTTVSVASKRRCMEPKVPMPIDPQADVPVSDESIASEVTRHVEADNVGGDGLDITSGLWLDHPQEASPLMCGLGISAPAVAGFGGGLSLPSLDEDEVLGFLACAENKPAGDIGL